MSPEASVSDRFASIRPEAPIPELRRVIRMADIVRFAGVSEQLGALHIDKDHARRVLGMPDVCIHGQHKAGMIGTMLTDWFQSDAVLVKLSCEYRRLDYCEDELIAQGRVVATRVEDGKGFVDCDIWIQNQRGERNTLGSATLLFPLAERHWTGPYLKDQARVAAPARVEDILSDSLVTSEALQMLGKETRPTTERVEAGMIRRWAKAVFNSNPLHMDEAAEQTGTHGTMIAPPTFVVVAARGFIEDWEMLRPPLKAKRGMPGGDTWEFFRPIRPGDTITRRQRLADIYEKQSKTGKRVFVTAETTFTNQSGELVAAVRSYAIHF